MTERRSYWERWRTFASVMPPSWEPSLRLTALMLFCFSDEDGGSIYASAETLQELTGLSRATLFRQFKTLKDDSFLLDDGHKKHTSGNWTRLRRLDLDAIANAGDAERARLTGETKPPVKSLTRETSEHWSERKKKPVRLTRETNRSPMDETSPRLTAETQCDKGKQEKEAIEIICAAEAQPTEIVQAKPKRQRAPKAVEPMPILPDWIPAEPWNEWYRWRASKKHPCTPYAMRLQIKHLSDLRNQGHDPADVLNLSIERGYSGLFAPSGTSNRSSTRAAKPTTKLWDTIEAASFDRSED